MSIYAGLGERSKPRGQIVEGPVTTAAAAALVAQSFQPGGGCVSTVEIHGVSWSGRGMSWESRPHDRHIGFSCGADIALERGLDSFDAERVTPDAGVAWSYVVSDEGKAKHSTERLAIQRASTKETV